MMRIVTYLGSCPEDADLEYLGSLIQDHSPDVVCLPKMQASVAEYNQWVKDMGLNEFHTTIGNGQAGFTAILTKEKATLVDDKLGFGDWENDGRWLCVRLGNVDIGCVHPTSNKNNKGRWLSELFEKMDLISKKGIHTVVGGEFSYEQNLEYKPVMSSGNVDYMLWNSLSVSPDNFLRLVESDWHEVYTGIDKILSPAWYTPNPVYCQFATPRLKKRILEVKYVSVNLISATYNVTRLPRIRVSK